MNYFKPIKTMKKLSLLAALAAVLLAGCCNKQQVNVWVANPIEIERTLETVEVPWDRVVEAIPAATPETVIVKDAAGAEIPSQVLFAEDALPLAVIFQATVPASGRSGYVIAAGTPAAYPQQAFGRYVPERKDDYAWENNLTAWRIYGPALRDELVTPGIDYWCKSTGDLVIDTWYKINDYHHDNGQGLDCYKVGPTLGAGASSPFADEKLWLAENWAQWENVENGPIRTTVRLTYQPFVFQDTQLTLTKTISLDANTRFNRVTDLYSGAAAMTIAAGMPMHEGAVAGDGEGWIALTEPASDLQDPAAAGDISIGVVMEGVTSASQVDGHLLIMRRVEDGSALTYHSGAGWSRAGIESPEAWEKIVERQARLVAAPLRVEIEQS
jgi:outer membrane murein-binding lipoprotein Lpp